MGNLLTDIAQGWYNYVKGSTFTKQLMEKRLKICDKCPHKKEMDQLGKVLVKSINAEGSIFKCGLCNCPLSALTAVPGKRCKDRRWPATHEESYF